jgi:hypothetical protein
MLANLGPFKVVFRTRYVSTSLSLLHRYERWKAALTSVGSFKFAPPGFDWKVTAEVERRGQGQARPEPEPRPAPSQRLEARRERLLNSDRFQASGLKPQAAGGKIKDTVEREQRNEKECWRRKGGWSRYRWTALFMRIRAEAMETPREIRTIHETAKERDYFLTDVVKYDNV